MQCMHEYSENKTPEMECKLLHTDYSHCKFKVVYYCSFHLSFNANKFLGQCVNQLD